MKIKGVPDGWELVRVGQVDPFEYWLNQYGHVQQWIGDTSTSKNFIIVCKIEKPKKYRPFENAAEAHRLWDAALKLANPAKGSEDSRYRINLITRTRAMIGLQVVDYRKAFEIFVCDDGTPFGIEVTE